jgi:aconitate hydratase
LELGDVIVLDNVREQLAESGESRRLTVRVPQKDLTFTVRHTLFPRMIEVVLAGGLTNWIRDQTPIQTSSTLPMKNEQSGIV